MKKTNCPKCNSQLILKDEIKVTKHIRCPQCKNEFDNPNYKKATSNLFKEFNSQKTSSQSSNKNKKSIFPALAIIIFIIGLGLTLNDDNTTYITQSGYMGAYNEDDLDKLTEYSMHKDYDAIDFLITNGIIFKIPQGSEAYVLKSTMSKVKIRLKGQSTEIWTVIEAIKEN